MATREKKVATPPSSPDTLPPNKFSQKRKRHGKLDPLPPPEPALRAAEPRLPDSAQRSDSGAQFFSQHILTRKGPLGHVWIAATLGEQKVTKRYAAKAEIVGLCSSICAPSAPFALRLSAQLMLGVARVFARKSEIVLCDSNALLHALQKHHAPPAAGFDTRGAAARGFAHGSITLGETDPGDAFNRITLPAQRKRNRGRKAARDAITGRENVAGRANGVTSLAVALQGDPAAIDLPASTPWMDSQMCFDIEGAMEMAFPSAADAASSDRTGTSPQHGNDGAVPGSLGGTPSQNKGSGSTYRARQEDITLSQDQNRFSDSDLMRSSQAGEDLLQYSLLGEEGLVKGSAVGSGNGGGSSNIFGTSIDVVDAGEAHYNLFGFSKFAKSPREENDPTGPENLDIPHRTVMAGNKNSNCKSAEPPSDDHGSAAIGDEMLRDHGENGNLVTLSPTVTARQGDVHMHNGTHDVDMDNVGVSDARPPKPPPRGSKMKFDRITELPTSHIRDCLNDSSTTIADTESPEPPAKKRRHVAPTRAAVELALLSNPFMGNGVAAELRELWNEVVAQPELDAMKSRNTKDQARSKKDDAAGKEGDTRESTATPDQGLAGPQSVDTPQANSLEDGAQQNFFPNTLDVQPAEAVFAGSPDAALRQDAGQIAADPVFQANNIEASGATMEPEKLRDRVFETVRLLTPFHLDIAAKIGQQLTKFGPWLISDPYSFSWADYRGRSRCV